MSGTAFASSTIRCRDGGCGPSMPAFCGPSATLFYPAWPLLTTNTKGVLNVTNRSVLKDELTAAKGAQKIYVDKIAAMPVADIIKDKSLSEFATAAGAAAFKVNCTPATARARKGASATRTSTTMTGSGAVPPTRSTPRSRTVFAIRRIRTPGSRRCRTSVKSSSPRKSRTLRPMSPNSRSSGHHWQPGCRQGGLCNNCAACHGDQAQGNRDLGHE